MIRMTDHYRATRTLLDQHADAVARLALEHDKRTHNPKRIAQLYEERNTALALAKVHSNLAIAQAFLDRGIGA